MELYLQSQQVFMAWRLIAYAQGYPYLCFTWSGQGRPYWKNVLEQGTFSDIRADVNNQQVRVKNAWQLNDGNCILPVLHNYRNRHPLIPVFSFSVRALILCFIPYSPDQPSCSNVIQQNGSSGNASGNFSAWISALKHRLSWLRFS